MAFLSNLEGSWRKRQDCLTLEDHKFVRLSMYEGTGFNDPVATLLQDADQVINSST